MPNKDLGEAMHSVRARLEHPLLYHIVTLGCQMNVRDSETIAGMLDEMGMSPTENMEDADLILYNTCCVRENAENKALGNVMWLKELKAKKPGLLIVMAGCMVQEQGIADVVRAQYPFVDVALGTHNLERLPELLDLAMEKRAQVIEVAADTPRAEGLPVRRQSKFMAFVNVMYGCNNFCSYCIVPYVRGRERSRDEGVIVDEVKALVDTGVKEVMLLGQNVNSFGGGGDRFAELLRKLDATGIERIRFMTSHPKDMSNGLIACFRELTHLCKQLHLPVQSGSDRILQRMNRKYDRSRYFDLIKMLRSVYPEIGLSSDFIVGFPGETEADFEDTRSLCEQVGYDAAFTFIYSPRVGTRAAEMPDDTPSEVKSERIQRLIAAQQRATAGVLSSLVGSEQRVLVESASARDPGWISGKIDRGQMVSFPGNVDGIGRFARVRITSAGKNTLRGVQLDPPYTGN